VQGVPPLGGVKQWWGGKTSYFESKCVNILKIVGDIRPKLLYTVSQKKSSTSYFAEYFCAGLTDCKNFNGYRVRDDQRTQVYNQCFNF